jgi:hypothetical protein
LEVCSVSCGKREIIGNIYSVTSRNIALYSAQHVLINIKKIYTNKQYEYVHQNKSQIKDRAHSIYISWLILKSLPLSSPQALAGRSFSRFVHSQFADRFRVRKLQVLYFLKEFQIKRRQFVPQLLVLFAQSAQLGLIAL